MAKKNLRQVVHEVGTAAHTIGDFLEMTAATGRKVVEKQPPLLPIADDDALYLAGGIALAKCFGWESPVGMSMIVRFQTALPKSGETFTLKGVKFGTDHPNRPDGKKVKAVEITKEVILSQSALTRNGITIEGDDPLVLIEMDATVDMRGRICLTPWPGIGFAYRLQRAPQPSALWVK